MKKRIFNICQLSLIVLLLVLSSSCFRRSGFDETRRFSSPAPDEVYDRTDLSSSTQNDQDSYQVFYDDLSPYGSWVDNSDYGYVWVPRVPVDFHPYATDGHWAMTNYGWTWVSDYRWGWAAFHYGRWAYEPRYGWMWLPGRVWGPAWVSWRESDEYFGWAPLGPFIDVSMSFNSPYDHYRFVPRRHFMDRNMHNYYVDRRNNVTIINKTVIINETHVVNKNKYYYGPRKELVETSVGQKIKSRDVFDNTKPDADREDNDRVKVYRPRMDNVSTEKKAVPKKVTRDVDLKPIPEEKRLSPSEKRKAPFTEGVEPRPQDRPTRAKDVPQAQPDIKKEPMPSDARPEDRRSRWDDVPQDKPDVKKETNPKFEPHRQDRPTRSKDAPADVPEVKKEPVPNNEPRPKVNRPRRDDVPQEKPTKTPTVRENTRKEKVNPPTNKEKEAAPPKKKTRDDN